MIDEELDLELDNDDLDIGDRHQEELFKHMDALSKDVIFIHGIQKLMKEEEEN